MGGTGHWVAPTWFNCFVKGGHGSSWAPTADRFQPIQVVVNLVIRMFVNTTTRVPSTIFNTFCLENLVFAREKVEIWDPLQPTNSQSLSNIYNVCKCQVAWDIRAILTMIFSGILQWFSAYLCPGTMMAWPVAICDPCFSHFLWSNFQTHGSSEERRIPTGKLENMQRSRSCLLHRWILRLR